LRRLLPDLTANPDLPQTDHTASVKESVTLFFEWIFLSTIYWISRGFVNVLAASPKDTSIVKPLPVHARVNGPRRGSAGFLTPDSPVLRPTRALRESPLHGPGALLPLMVRSIRVAGRHDRT
jgi:hypothetical protein